MNYVDGFVAAVPTAGKKAYLTFALVAAAVFKDHGAIRVVECWGQDVPEGKLTSFPMAVKLDAHETVVFSWIIWPNQEVRNQGMDKAMADPRMPSGEMPFDGKRMIFGGFEVMLDE